jgi:hypothetical protein
MAINSKKLKISQKTSKQGKAVKIASKTGCIFIERE